jgi:hypothetical protein
MVSILRHNNFKKGDRKRQERGEQLAQPDAAGFLQIGALSHRLGARSSQVLHVALFSVSPRSGWRFELAVFAGEVFVRATSKHSMEML